MSYFRHAVFVVLCLIITSEVTSSYVMAIRFFEKNSTFYEKIPPNPEIDPNSQNYIQKILNDYPRIYANGVAGSSARSWSYPVYYADESTPVFTIKRSDDPAGNWCNFTPQQLSYMATCLNGWHIGVPLNSSMKPAGYGDTENRDRTMIVIRPSTKEGWEFFKATYDDSIGRVTSALRIKRFDLTENGVHQPDTCGNGGVAARLGLHGLIMLDEIVRDRRIDHALVAAFPMAPQGTHGVYPMRGINSDGISTDPWELQIGMRLQMDPTIDFSREPDCDPVFCQVIAKALQEYGIFNGENGGDFTTGRGAIQVYAENRGFTDNGWENVLSKSLTAIQRHLGRMRVVKPIYPQGEIPDTQPTSRCGVMKPKITPDGGAFGGTVSVRLSTTTSGAVIRYTLDGTAPTATSPLYSGPFSISKTAIVKAVAFRDGFNNSPVVTSLFSITSDRTVPISPTGLILKQP